MSDDKPKHITAKHERKLIKIAQAGNAAKAEIKKTKETKRLLRKVVEGLEARNELLTAHAGFLHSRANYWCNRYPKIEYDEYHSEAAISMCKAIDKFDLDLNLRLITYAWRVIDTEMCRFFRKHHIIRTQVDGKSPPLKVLSLDLPMGESQEGMITMLIGKNPDPSYGALYGEECDLIDKASREILNDLQRDVFYRKFRGATIEEIANERGVTTSSIGQTYNRALYKLTKYFEENKAG